MAYLLLAAAIITEVGATLSLRMATSTKKLRWWLPVLTAYTFAFTSLTFVLQLGVPLGVAYGVWAALGVILTAVLSRVLFKEPLTWLMAAGMALIVGGVLMIELGSGH